MTEIIELIGQNKIIAVTGSPGQGKTEFVRALAHTLANQGKYPKGIFWSSGREDEKDYPLKNLESIFNAVLTAKDVAGVEKIHIDEKKRTVSRILESGEALFVLDNFETVIDDEEIIAYLQQLSPDARFILATRHSLAPNLAKNYTLKSLIDNGVALFWSLLEKTGYFDWTQRTQEEESRWGEEVCQILDGHPLSLVLAAGNASYNLLEDIASKLQKNPYNILQSKNRPAGTPEGLWKSIDLSLSPLDPPVQELFLKLSVFYAPADYEAIEVVLGEDELDYLLNELVLRNLLNRDKRRRYFYLPVLRMVSQNLLVESNLELACYHRKAADYFKKRDIPESARALDHLEWLCHQKNAPKKTGQEMVDLMVKIETKLFTRGFWNLDEEKIKQTLAVSQELDLRKGEMELLTHLGWLRHHKRDLDQAEELHLKAKKICEELNDQIGIAYQIKHLAWIYVDQGKLDKAEQFYEKSLAIFEKEKNNADQVKIWKNQADIWSARGGIYKRQGEYEKAEEAILLALRIATEQLKGKEFGILCRIWTNLY